MKGMKVTAQELQEKAREMRKLIIEMLVEAGSGHTGGPLGSADFWSVLYFSGVMNYKADEPWWEERDRVILSAGHYCPVQYAALALAGYFPEEELWTLRKTGSRLQGHPVARVLPGIENSSGPLGQGISQAVGTALAGKHLDKSWRVYCFMGDGEQQEGQVWEAYMAAAKFKLDNLTIIVDRNHMQIGGDTEKVMPIDPLSEKLRSFGLEVIEVDGHKVEGVVRGLERSKVVQDKATVIVLKTTPGKGVSFMEGDTSWHGKAPNEEEAKKALLELGYEQQ